MGSSTPEMGGKEPRARPCDLARCSRAAVALQCNSTHPGCCVHPGVRVHEWWCLMHGRRCYAAGESELVKGPLTGPQYDMRLKGQAR